MTTELNGAVFEPWGISGRPFPGEKVSGDMAFAHRFESGDFFAVVDALGHGPEAHDVAVLAEAYLQQLDNADLLAAIDGLNAALFGSRGAAATLAFKPFGRDEVSCLGVGNTALRILSRENGSLVPTDGIVGQRFRSPRIQTLPLARDALLIMHSDGVNSAISLNDLPSARYQGPQAISRTIIRNFSKPFDDAICLVARYRND
jgi:hypothetical protein